MPSIVLSTAAVGLLLICQVAFGAAPQLPPRAVRTVQDFTIEFTPGDEAYVDALAARLPGFTLPPVEPNMRARLTVADLAARREHFLNRIAGFVGLTQPTPEMGRLFDDFGGGTTKLTVAMTGLPRRYAIWRRTEILQRLQAGEKVPGFTAGGPTGLLFNREIGFGSMAREGVSLDDIPWPIDIGRTEGKSVDEDIDDDLAQMRERIPGMEQMFSHASVFLVLHEVTEWVEITHYIASKDRRWFCDGVANYVAMKIITAEVGADETRRYYDLEQQLRQYAEFAPRIDLEKWPAAENKAKANYAEDLNTADYAFATKVIADICAKHGDDLLPKLFREIGKTPRDKVTMTTVHRAFRKLTGEDMRKYLPRPGKSKK